MIQSLPTWFGLRSRRENRPHPKVAKAEKLERVRSFGDAYVASLRSPHPIANVAPEYANNCLAMMAAAAKGRSHLLELEELLGSKHCNANFVNEEGFCALHSATFHGHLLVVKMLLRFNAKVNLPSSHPMYEGFTALHFAACSAEDLELIELLLLHGADPAARTADGDTPYSLAVAAGAASAVTDKLLGGDLLRAELTRLGLYAKLRPVLLDNHIDTLSELDSLSVTELLCLRDCGGVTRVSPGDALKLWCRKNPSMAWWGWVAARALFCCLLLWMLLMFTELVLGRPLFDHRG